MLYYDMLMCCVSLSIVAYLNILDCNGYPETIIVIPLEAYVFGKKWRYDDLANNSETFDMFCL